MPRLSTSKRAELEAFWRAHLDGWRRSDLNQRQYCELHGLPLKRFGNWRAKLKGEEPVVSGKLLYRRGGGLSHMSGHMTYKDITQSSATYIPSAGSLPPGGRRRFSEADKVRLVEEIDRPGASVSSVARRHGIAVRQLFRWKQELAPTETPKTTFLPVTVTDALGQGAEISLPRSEPAPVIVERPAPGIEVELVGGRRVRFDRDTDPETIHRLVSLLEGEAR